MHYLLSLTRSRSAKSVYVYTYIVMDWWFVLNMPSSFLLACHVWPTERKKGNKSPPPPPHPPTLKSVCSVISLPACPGQYTHRSFWSWMSTIDTFHWLTDWSGQFPYPVAASFSCVDLDCRYGFLSGSRLREQCCILRLPVITLWYVFIVEKKNSLHIFCT